MTINEAITKTDAIKPNTFTAEEKIGWLSYLDGMIKAQIIEGYEDSEDVYFNGYDINTDGDTELIVPSPWDDIYIKWLCAQIDYANAEYDRYNNAVKAYNAAYDAYARYYHRTHMPRTKRIRY